MKYVLTHRRSMLGSYVLQTSILETILNSYRFIILASYLHLNGMKSELELVSIQSIL